jgi:hypothetical protein
MSALSEEEEERRRRGGGEEEEEVDEGDATTAGRSREKERERFKLYRVRYK